MAKQMTREERASRAEAKLGLYAMMLNWEPVSFMGGIILGHILSGADTARTTRLIELMIESEGNKETLALLRRSAAPLLDNLLGEVGSDE